MKLRGKERNKFIHTVLVAITTFILLSCFITLIIDIANNKGILPIIFFTLMIYSLIVFLYYLFYGYHYVGVVVKTSQFKLSYLLFFVVNLFLFFLSVVSLWM